MSRHRDPRRGERPRGREPAGRRGDPRGDDPRRGGPRRDEPRPHRPRTTLPQGVAEEIRATARPHRADEVIRLVEEAAQALSGDDPVGGERAGSTAKGMAPRSATVREVLGLALYHQERFRDALRELLAYRRLSGRMDQNHVIADCHRALGAPEKAVRAAREGLTAPLDLSLRAECAVVGGAALADLGRYEEALAVLRSIPTRRDVSRDHDLRLWYVIGDVLERAGQREEAADQFRQVVRHDPDAFDAAERLEALS